MTKFYENVQRKIVNDKVLEKSSKYTRKMFEAKMKYILKMKKKLEDLNTVPNAYCILLNRLLNDKKILAITLLTS